MTTRNTGSLDTLLAKANFIDANSVYNISEGKKLTDYIKSNQTYMSYRSREPDGEVVFRNMLVVAYDDPTNYSSAIMYQVRGECLERAVNGQMEINLSEEMPDYCVEVIAIDKEVVRVLRRIHNRDSIRAMFRTTT